MIRARPVTNTSGGFSSPWFWGAAGFVVFVFFTGGSARGDVLSLPLLRPVAALLLACASAFLRVEDVRAHRAIVGLTAAIVATMALQLMPLPPSIWTHLPHRDLAVDAVQVSGMASEWRPISLVPSDTRNALFSLIVPAAMLAVALHLTAGERAQLMWVVIGIGAAGIVLGVLQVSTSPSPTFYLYRVSSQFTPTGFFANPNHNAAFLAALLPITACAFSSPAARAGWKSRELAIDAVAVAVIALTILLAGSRAGVGLAVMGLAAMPLARKAPEPLAARRLSKWVVAGAVGIVALAAIAMLTGRARALERLLAGGATGDIRLLFWPIIVTETGRYFPVGAGWGSFVETFQAAEPYRLLGPTYLNHAHNDWLEVVMGGGIIGAAMLVFVAGWWVWSIRRLLRIKRQVAAPGWAAIAAMLVMGLSSIADYPLRTPSLQVLFVLCWLWVGDVLQPDLGGFRRRQSVATGRPPIDGLQ